MNHIPMRMNAPAVRPQKMTRRALAKQQTREKVLQSARDLFIERGYEGATIRDIARAAGMSTGAVFASFTDKTELFDAILNDDFAALQDPMQDALVNGKTTREALVGMFGAAYRAHADQLPLIQAALAASWTRTPEAERLRRESLRPIRALVIQALERGVEHGELAARVDLRLVADMLWDLYLAGYRPAAFDGLSVENQTERLAQRIDVILAALKA
ncbi:TetR/AcrR family transcriptional regulator [Caulobacter mirabilis]|uniref:TetR family transcriptional regulator n=1 Tax=Caulobacter mirabilis TaxID=69666 RepID=A0A2D2B279_9CAUL|nr:TetR/AcrR family transcriptional regulator [Caulobacter mirabilis]ATQ44327.1 TetR family transcriptional regulator [Caulobacter mirabilis]